MGEHNIDCVKNEPTAPYTHLDIRFTQDGVSKQIILAINPNSTREEIENALDSLLQTDPNHAEWEDLRDGS